MDTNTKEAPQSVGLIYAAMAKVMGEIGAVAKDRKNPQQGYAFRGIDDLYNAAQPAMVKHGVFCAPTVTERIREERQGKSGGTLFYTTLTVRHRFYASDGSFVDVVTVGEAMDSGDKSTNKAMSAAMKYALIEVFAVPTEEDNDTENQTHEAAPRNGQSNGHNGHSNGHTEAAQRAKEQEVKAALAREEKEAAAEQKLIKLLAVVTDEAAIDAEVPAVRGFAPERQKRLSPYFLGARKRVQALVANGGVVGAWV
jgi:hypothetical protein